MPDRTSDGRSVDVLADIFDTVHVERAGVVRLELPTAPSADVEATRAVVLYATVKGRLSVQVGEALIAVGEGDVLCLPMGSSHSVRSGADGASETATVVRAVCSIADPEKNPLIQALPPTLLVSPSQWVKQRWLEPTLEILVRESVSPKSGARVVVARMLELLLLQLVRTHIDTTPVESQGWLRALSDAQIGSALGLIHDRPAEEYTVAGLAHAVGMSRSAFASQFTRLVGEPPLHYVARWRMLKAAQLLKENRLTLAEVAATVGYESEAAFSKAFKRSLGQAPGSYRRERTPASVEATTQALAG
jgi:AraC-like DNA-binding protein/quercetin dioxygenase-like cupin family protein